MSASITWSISSAASRPSSGLAAPAAAHAWSPEVAGTLGESTGGICDVLSRRENIPGARAGSPLCRRAAIHSGGAMNSVPSRIKPVPFAADVEELQGRGQQDEGQCPADQAAREARTQVGADIDAGNAADQQRERDRQLEVAEQQVPESGRPDQGDGLHQVSPDQFRGAQPRVERHQGDDDQRAGADRGHPDEKTANHTYQRPLATVGRSPEGVPAGVAQPDRCGPEPAPASAGRPAPSGPMAATSRAIPRASWITFCTWSPWPSGSCHQHTRERRRHRPDAQPADELEVDRAPPEMHEGTNRLHHRRRHQVAGDRSQWRHAEEQDEHGRHQRPAAHPRQPHDDPDAASRQRHRPVPVHQGRPL